ncbi:MAG: O-antigen ligase family protein [Candidatus Krumholzibacteria bacterium]|nr:O-antigen ligase family protein [Candidatus Krumholzibacteria bacterium]
MKLLLCGEAINAKRLLLFVVVPLACLAVAATIFLPSGLIRLAVMLTLVLPIAFLFLDRPSIVFYILILILFSNLDVYAPFRLYRYVIIFVFASFALALASGRRVVTHHPLMIALLGAFTIIAFQSISVARDYDLAVRKMGWFVKMLVALAIMTQFTRDRSEFRKFLLVLAAGILLSDFLPFVVRPPAQLRSLSLLWGQGVVRYGGFIYEPNVFAMCQLFLIPILMFFVGAYRKPAIGLFLVASIIASIGVLTLSFSRGGFVGLICLLLTLIVVERKNRAILFLGLVLIVVGIIAVPDVYWERVGSLFDFAAKRTDDFAISTRVETIRAAFRLGLENPLLGVGIDNFMGRSQYLIPFTLTVHNAFMQIFAELGLIAFAVFIGMIAYNVIIIRRLMARRDDPEAALLGRALCMQQVAMLVNSFFIPVAYEMVFWFMLVMPAIGEYAYRVTPGASSRADEGSTGRK